MRTRCNRWFLYCRSYCLLNTFRAPLCPSSGSQEYCTGGCCLWYLVLWFSSCRSGVELRVMCPVCGMLQHPIQIDLWHRTCKVYNTGRFIMFYVITNFYKKKSKEPTLMELFTATGKLKRLFLTTRHVRCVHQG